ncbi:MAG: tetratricopeptide repeat protein [Planctomycetota bacterium]
MRQFNLRLILWLAGIFVVAAVSIHLLHGYQVRQNKDAFLDMARETKASFRDMVENQSGTPAELQESALQAVTFYRRYLGLDPEDLAVRIEYAKFLLDIGDFRSAYVQHERILRQTVTADPELQAKQEEARRNHVQLARLSEEYSDAIYHVNQLLETHENDPSLLEQRGILYMQLEPTRDNTDTARASFKGAIEHGPDQLSAYSRLASLQLQRDRDPQGATATIRAMVEANPQSAEAYVRRAQFILTHNDPSDWVISERDTGLESGTEGGTEERAILSDWLSRERRQRVQRAMDDCEQALELSPEYPAALDLLAACHQQLSGLLDSPDERDERIAAHDKALELTKRLVALTGENPQPQLYLRWSNLELSSPTTGSVSSAQEAAPAIAAIREGIEAVPSSNNADLRFRLAELLLNDPSRREEAVELISELETELSAQDPRVAYLRARHAVLQQDYLAAAKILDSNREQLQNYSGMFLSDVDLLLGQCYRQLGYDDRYLAAAQQAAQRNPLSMKAQLNLARAHVAMNHLAQAIEQYQIVVRPLQSKEPDALLQDDEQVAYKEYISLLLTRTYRQSPGKRDWRPVTAAINDLAGKTPPGDPWVTLMRAEMLIARDQVPEAEEALLAARDQHPNQLGIWRALVLIAQREGDTSKTRQRLQELEDKFGDSVTLRTLKGEIIAREQPEDGVSQLAELTTDTDDFSEGERAQLYWQLARNCFSLAAHNQGLEFAQQAAELDPGNLRLRLFMLRIARLAVNADVAEQLAREINAIESGGLAAGGDSEPDEARRKGAVTLYAEAAARVTRYRAALLAAQEADRENQDSEQTLTEKAKRDHAQLLAEANQKLEQAQQLRNNWSEVPVLQGIIADLQGKPNLQLDFFRHALDLGSRNTKVAYHVVQTLAREATEGRAGNEEKWLEADAIIRKLQDEQSSLPLELGRLASHINYQRKDFDRALDLALPLSKTGEVQDQRWVGQVAMAMNRYDEAQKQLESAAETSPEDPVVWTMLVRCLVLSDKLDEAEARMNEALDQVDPRSRLAVHVECLQMINREDEAVELIQERVESEDVSPAELRTAALFLSGIPSAHDDAIPILEQFVNGELKTETDPAATRQWARRTLAQVIGRRDDASYLRAIGLLDQNLADDPDSIPDRRLRAKLLFAGARTEQQQHQAVADLFKLAENPAGGLDPECRFLLAQHYLNEAQQDQAGSRESWRQYRDQMIKLLSVSDGNPRQRTYMESYVNALLEHGDRDTAQAIASTLRRQWPEHLSSYLVRAKTLLAGPRPDAEQALQVVQRAIEDPDIQPESKSAKLRQAAVRLGSLATDLQDRLQQLAADPDATSEGQEQDARAAREALIETGMASVKAASRQYFDQLAQEDPSERLASAPYLAAEGETARAVELVENHWETVPPRNLAQTCRALLDTLPTNERGVIEEVLQQAIEKHAGTDDAVPLLSALAHHYMDYQRFDESITLYQDLVKQNPDNVAALNNLALLMAARNQNPAQALEYIDQAADIVGEQSFLLDTQATVLLANNQPEKAVQTMQQVLAQKPREIDKQLTPALAKRWGVYHFHLAMAYQANDQPQKAAEEMKTATALGLTEEDVFAPELPRYRELVSSQ